MTVTVHELHFCWEFRKLCVVVVEKKEIRFYMLDACVILFCK